MAGTDVLEPVASGWQLILAAVAAIALIVVLITVAKLHPFLALIGGGLTIGIPALAGLSAMHGLVPPHPGPLTAIDYLDADLGITLALGVLVAVPTVIISGPVFARFAGNWVDVPAPNLFDTTREDDEKAARRPSFTAPMPFPPERSRNRPQRRTVETPCDTPWASW